MLKRILPLFVIAHLSIGVAQAQAEVPITGTVASKCVIHADTPGVFGNPSSNVLSTDPQDGGINPIIRYDVVIANSYKAVISTPVDFVTSPALSDTLNWQGTVSVSAVTDPSMSVYDTNKRTFNNVTEFDLVTAGTVWFKADVKAEYGYNKSLPGGAYKAVVIAQCIAL
jgi:hypothetical protein